MRLRLLFRYLRYCLSQVRCCCLSMSDAPLKQCPFTNQKRCRLAWGLAVGYSQKSISVLQILFSKLRTCRSKRAQRGEYLSGLNMASKPARCYKKIASVVNKMYLHAP